MQAMMRIDRCFIGQQRVCKQLVCMKGQLPSYRHRQASRVHSVSGSRVHGWQPPQHEQQLAPPHAVAAPESPPVELEPEQQQQEGAAPYVPRNNAYVRRKSEERVRMAKDLGLDRTAAPGRNGSTSTSSGWLELADAAAAPVSAEPATADQAETAADAAEPATADQTEAVADAVRAPEAAPSPPPAQSWELRPRGWAAATAAAAAEDVTTTGPAVTDPIGTTTYTFKNGANSSSSCSNGSIRVFDDAFGTAVDCEAAAAATTAAANLAAATAAAANVASVEHSSLCNQERQPQLAPTVPVVRMELARSPDGAEPAHFYMPDPLCIPCVTVEAGGQQQQEALPQAYNKQQVAACWRQAGRVAVTDMDPETDAFVLLDYDELEHQMDQPHQLTAPAAAAAAAAAAPGACVVAEAAGASDASLANGSGGSSSGGEADAGCAAVAAGEAQQQPEQQLPQQEVQPGVAVVDFCFRCVTQPGERLWLVGDGAALGSWDAAAAAKMKWGEGHTWSVSLPFEQGAKVAYKAVLQLAGKEPKHWRWQAGANCVVEARSSASDGKPLKVQHDFK